MSSHETIVTSQLQPQQSFLPTMLTTEKGRRRETTLEERSRVTELHAMGISFKAISDELGWVSKDGACKICKKWNTGTGTQHNGKRPGRSQQLSERDRRYILRLSDSHPRMTQAEITAEAGLNIQLCTTGKYLRKMNRFVRLAHHKPWW
ncbi:hypothetical protein HOY80DRAFT_1002284 [Tuber brumale]|nr:hypothetical protein HOY80DRAFT_1002284 [Tuber brumale]